MKRGPLSWDPVRRGSVYCAPACGRGCTRAEYKTAVAGAARLCATLGKGWIPRVWENMGWHYQAVSPCHRWRICPNHGGGFTAFLGVASPPDQSGKCRWAECGRTPISAMRATWKRAKVEIDEYASLLDAAPKARR